MPAPKPRLRAFALAMTVLIATPLAVAASDVFTDVPDSNVFHDDIAWLADAGVTKGCNPPDNTEFCPKDDVTREQMAAFMRRLSENQVVDAATALEADHAATADSAKTALEADHAATADSADTAEDANTLDGYDSPRLLLHWIHSVNGEIRSHSPGLEGVTVVRPPSFPVGTFCIFLPDGVNQPEAAVGSVQDTGGGFDEWGMAVTTTRGHFCNETGSWDIGVDITVDGAPADSDFSLMFPATDGVHP